VPTITAFVAAFDAEAFNCTELLKSYLVGGNRITNFQRWARIRTGSDWIRTEANFGRIRTGLDCNFFEDWRSRTGSDWENIFCFNVIIL